MAVRNRRVAEGISADIEDFSEAAAETGRKTAESITETASSTALAAFDVFNRPIMKVMDQNRVFFQKMVHTMQEESLRFVNRRLEHTSRAIESTRECQGVTGLMGVQQEFLMELARDYAEQTRRFADLVRELAEDGASGFTDAAGVMNESFRRASQKSVVRTEDEHRAAAE